MRMKKVPVLVNINKLPKLLSSYVTFTDSPYDWLFAYPDVADVIQNLLPDKDKSILMIGCGNAPFSPDM